MLFCKCIKLFVLLTVPSTHSYAFTPKNYFLFYKVFFFSFFFYSLFFHKLGIFSKTSFQFFLIFWEYFKNWVKQWFILLHVPYTSPPIYFLPKNYYYYFFFLFFHFHDSLLFHKSGDFYKTSFQIFLSFREHVKTWVRQWIITLHVPYTPLLFFLPKNYYFI